MSTKNNTNSFDKYRVNRPIDIVIIAYLIFISSVFCFYMDNKYFNITATRAKLFTYSGIALVILAVMAYGVEFSMIRYFNKDEKLFVWDKNKLAMPELWITLFLLANTFAWFMSENKKGSWTGETGRCFGLALVIVITLVVIILCRQSCISQLVFISLSATAALAFIIAYLQHFGHDPFELRITVVKRQKEMFISTFGNINTYGAYICIVLPIFAAVFIFSKKLWARIVAGSLLVMSGAAILPAKSDNVYLGTAAAFLVLFYVAIMNKRFTEYIFSVLLLVFGLTIMSYLNKTYSGSQKHINGIAEIIENPSIMMMLLVIVSVILVATLVFRQTKYELYKSIQNKKFLIIFSIVFVVGVLFVIIYGISTQNSLFVFNDKWGTFRGYIWRRCWNIFEDADPLHKLFGHGNETIAAQMKQFYSEMVSVTGKKYDNAHNELLQYLVTTGLFGVVSYLGFVFTSFVYMLKRLKGDPIAIACLAGGVSYFAQSIVNLNQPITAPLFFVIVAAGVGHLRYRDQGYGKYKNKML